MGEVIVPPWHARKKKDKVPTTNCKQHGLVELRAMCPKCFKELSEGHVALQEALKETPNVVRKLSDSITELRQDKNVLERVVDEIRLVTHKQYCKKELDSPDDPGEHHPACQYITDLLEAEDGKDLRTDSGQNGSPDVGDEGDHPPPAPPDSTPDLR